MKPDIVQNTLDYKGLNEKEVQERIAQHGFNELPSAKPKNFFQIAFEIIREPMFLLLVICCGLYIILGDLQEALMLSVFVIVIIGITLFQSWKTEKTLSALKDLTSPKSLVIRDGKEISIASRELVVDDILVLNEGDKISADALVLNTINLMVDESSLTGESVAVKKNNADEKLTATKLGDEQSTVVYNGTFVVQGKAYTKVIAIAANTELGKIGKSITTITNERSRLKKEITQIVSKILIIAGILFLVILTLLTIRQGFVKALLASLTFAIAMLPEEVPAVLTIFMALGAWRISKKNVLTREMAAIETLGSVTVLCSDKTGTITQNKMILTEVYANGKFHKLNQELLPKEFHSLIEFSILASKEKSFDPMEQALSKVASDGLIDAEHIHADWKFVKEYPLSKELSAMSIAWRSSDKEEFDLYSKGSPEAIFNLCHLNDSEIKSLTSIIEEMAARGLRILGVAKSKSKLNQLPENQHDIDFEFAGFVGFTDPIREGVKEAVQDCYSAGIKVIMITGDYHATAQNIAKQIGLQGDKYLIGAEFEKLSDEELKTRIKDVVIFSRVLPEQKLRIVNALRANNEVSIMTGDGVNDAPALKASSVGVAMGSKGTNVAREASDMILLDDNFSSIVSAIKLGRTVFANLRKAISYIISIHIPIAGLTLVPVIFGDLPVIFFPIHVAFLELIIDPTCSVVFESEPATNDIMQRKPRNLNEPILTSKQLLISIAQGLLVLGLVLAVYFYELNSGKSDSQVRMTSFATLLAGSFLLTFVNKSWKSKSISQLFFDNKSVLIVLAIVLGSFGLILSVPILRALFYF